AHRRHAREDDQEETERGRRAQERGEHAREEVEPVLEPRLRVLREVQDEEAQVSPKARHGRSQPPWIVMRRRDRRQAHWPSASNPTVHPAWSARSSAARPPAACPRDSAAGVKLMCGKGDAERIERSGCGKRVVGMSRPERSSKTRYFARRIPRIDFERMARSPTRKLSAATRKNESAAETRKRSPARGEAGGFSGKTSASTIEMG